jgi:hypothetical protein
MLGYIYNNCSFYGSKGEKVRYIDLSSRVRGFVNDSKNTVAIVQT